MNRDKSSVWQIKKKNGEGKVSLLHVEKVGICQVGKVRKLSGNSESVDESV